MDLRAAAIAANRFGLGARPGELKTIASDPRGWIKSQLTPEGAPPAPIAALPATEDDLLAFPRWLAAKRFTGANADKAAAKAANLGYSDADLKALSTEQSFALNFAQRHQRAVKARIDAACTTNRPVFERLVHFWANHFTVSAAKPVATAAPASFERDAIRPHAAGAFEAMLVAATSHPGMLLYLDNWLSVGPHTPAATAPRFGPAAERRPRGLNENLAREILELHTLGVKGGYTQKDVQALAAIITGWTYDQPGPLQLLTAAPGKRSGAQMFRFEARAHEPGAQTLLAIAYRQNGQDQGLAALHDLARHPATARFIATKLARHYVGDDPPAPAVERIAKAFTKSDGNLKTTMEAVVDAPEAWAQPFAKFKRPEEFMISFLRLANIANLPAPGLVAGLAQMGQPTYRAPGPNGWADSADAWLSPDLVWKRVEWVEAAAARIARADIDPEALGEAALGPHLAAETREAISRAQSPAQALTILAASSEFQRR